MRKHVKCPGDHPCPPQRVILVSLLAFVEMQRERQNTSTYMCAYSLSCVQLFFDPMDCSPARLLCLWDFSGKNIGMGCHFLLQGIVPGQGSNLHLLYWQVDSLPLSYKGSPHYLLLISSLNPLCSKSIVCMIFILYMLGYIFWPIICTQSIFK